jgi:predicted transposase YbfD/YdcC
VDVKDAIVSIDAMGTQKAIAAKIIDKGGDYVLPVKGNQGNLEQDVKALLDEALENDFKGLKVSRHHTREQHHGRIEQRWYYQINVPQSLRRLKQWKGLRTLGLVVRTRETDGVETGDVQYYISSLKRGVNANRGVKTFAKAVRGHWGIENTCHWSLDMTFREDESRTRDRHVAENLAWLRRFTLGLLKQHPSKKHSLVMKRRMAGWNSAFLTEILFGTTT